MERLFNFSTEESLTTIELVDKIIQLTGKTSIQPTILGKADSEIKAQTLSAEKAREILGWRPEFSLDEGLQETIHWYNRFLDNLEEERRAG